MSNNQMIIESEQKKSQTSYLIKIIKFLDANFEKVFIAIGLFLCIFLITAQIVNRYLLPFIEIVNMTTWTEELARYIFIWISYLGASFAIKKRETIQIDTFKGLFPITFSRALNVTNPLVMIIICYIVSEKGINIILQQLQSGQTSPAIGLPMAIPYLAVPVGFILMGIRLIQNLLSDIREMKKHEIALGLIVTIILILPVFFLENVSSAIILFVYFAIFIVIGMPIAFALGAATLGTTIATQSIPLQFFSQASFTSIDNFPIMAVPLFIAAGIIMGGGDLIKRLLKLADEMVGFLPGGLALVAVVTCMFFAAISGSGPATVAAVGTILIPAMIKNGYNPGFAAAIVAAAGSIGVIIPPSTPFIIYGVAAQQSISQLFIAGIIPGIIIGLGLMAVTYVIAKRNGWRGDKSAPNLKSLAKSTWDAKLALLVPIIILGGIYGGFMTPTEASAIAVVYGLIVSLLIYRDTDLKTMYYHFVNAGITSSTVIILIAMASIFGRLITVEGIAQTIAEFIISVTDNKIIILLLINILLLIIGVIMEALAAIVILTPILLPIILQLGVDPIHFGIIMVFNLAIGFITPPVGVNLFVTSGISKLRIEEIAKKAIPMILVMIILLIIFTYIPGISLWLISLNN